MTEAIDLDHLRQWIGRTEEKTDIVTAHLVAGLRSALFLDVGNPKDGDAAPFTAHWCLTLPVVALSRRMWAGGAINFVEPLRVGDTVTRASTIKDLTLKTGSTGTLCFVSVDHVISTPRGVAVRERHDIVYREMPADGQNATPAKPPAAPPAARYSERHLADPVLLFRYSALTFNGHRIHYDRDYVTKVEGYPGLIVHGPLQAALLVEMAAKLHGGKAPATFVYRGLQPLFEGSEFSVNAADVSSGLDLWTANSAGQPTMRGTATW